MVTIFTFFLHARLEALAKATVPALVPFVLVHRTVPGEAARVEMILSDAASEESLAAIAAGRSVVFSGCTICANGTGGQRTGVEQEVGIVGGRIG